MDDFQIDARRWRFLNNPKRYVCRSAKDLQLEPLKRQFKTVEEILSRFKKGHGVLLADDVGLGKTTVGALVAWILACQKKRVRIYVPNEVLRRRWAEELQRHVPMLEQMKLGKLGASSKLIKQGWVGKLQEGRIQVATHHDLVRTHRARSQPTQYDLMIVDEAHRAKGVGTAFNQALGELGDRAWRKLILTATPFSIGLEELERLLKFVGAGDVEAVRRYGNELMRLHALGDGHDVRAESRRIVDAAQAAIDALRPFVIRHGIEDLQASERKHFGPDGAAPWQIPAPEATQEELSLLLRTDRILQRTNERSGGRRNDPRFHVGWRHVATELDRARGRVTRESDHTVLQHIQEAQKSVAIRCLGPHPKIAVVSEAIREVLDADEKVLVFCHHRATASELLGALELSLKVEDVSPVGPPEEVWREAWENVLDNDDPLLPTIIDWLCAPGLRRQVGRWIGKPAGNVTVLKDQLENSRPRNAGSEVPTILVAARKFANALLDRQSMSTRALLKAIASGRQSPSGGISRFPGHLDDGFRAMGAWDQDGHGEQPTTLYTGKPDIVLAMFNSPFGPDVLVATDRLSEGVDLHRYCRHLIHYELDPSPARTLQRNGRVRRVSSWAAMTGRPICYAYPTFGGTRDEKAVSVMKQRINAFGLLLGGVPALDDDPSESEQSFAADVLRIARKELKEHNKKLCVTDGG